MSDRRIEMELGGLHHLTAVTTNAAENVAFYTDALGMRPVKKNLKQDDTAAYHLLHGAARLRPRSSGVVGWALRRAGCTTRRPRGARRALVPGLHRPGGPAAAPLRGPGRGGAGRRALGERPRAAGGRYPGSRGRRPDGGGAEA